MRHLQITLLTAVAGLVLDTNAVPSVNVALQTAFNAPPYLIELLETAADENATAYFPLLDRIAEGYFDGTTTDEELYTKFRTLLQQDGHLTQAEDLSSFDFALSIHSTAPRIAAHYQFYNTSAKPSIATLDDADCETWAYVAFTGQRFCSPDMAESGAQVLGEPRGEVRRLPFDRILGAEGSNRPSILYADILSKSFRAFHKTLRKTAREGTTSYRIRYKPSALGVSAPLTVSGYGVELALKRTDYIVIDDRDAEDDQEGASTSAPAAEATLSEEDVSDLRPLSSSELLRLGLKASSFVMSSDAPFDTLLKLSQDFPKHTSTIAGVNVSDDFFKEHRANRELVLPAGFNVIWINGVQIMARDLDAYSLLEYLRRERKMIHSVRELGLTGAQAIDLLAHNAITAAAVNQDVQRYDWRDENEGGDVIIWLNDLEKDTRYADWPESIMALLQRTYPGQLPPVRRDIHNVVITVDFSNFADVMTVVENIQSFIQRLVPIRFGLVPRCRTPPAVQQAKTIYYLVDRYGLSAALQYLVYSVTGAGRKHSQPVEKYFIQATHDRKLRGDGPESSFDEVLVSDEFDQRLRGAEQYIRRLGAGDSLPPILVNGAPIKHADDWLQTLSQRISLDLRLLQQAVYDEQVNEDSYLPHVFLASTTLRRNPIVSPEDDKSLRHVNLGEIPEIALLPSIPASDDTIERELVHLTIVTDTDTKDSLSQIMEVLLFRESHDNVQLAFCDSRGRSLDSASLMNHIKWLEQQYKDLVHKLDPEDSSEPDYTRRGELYEQLHAVSARVEPAELGTSLTSEAVVKAVNVTVGQHAFVINGRVVGPMPSSTILENDDLEALFTYERKKRLLPAALAIDDLDLQEKASTPAAFARISNLIALSQVSDVPEGIFEAAPTVRTEAFKQWNSTHTAIKVGNEQDANVQVTAVIDPASETGQRWLPIVKVLSELNGVATTVFLNPKERMEEIPVKRFYRHVLQSKPSFGADGSLEGLSASFNGMPADALLNMGMDLPPSWLVAPKISIHDLDNIKLSAIRSGTDIDAIYELEHILIEGHSRDVTIGSPPRGVQLVLGTELNPHSADTLIMANLGYFQFKANPGVFNLTLQRGRSEAIFHIDSAGTLGYSPQPGDDTTEITLTSFRGATIFPRLSRKPGMEEEDVLEEPKTALHDLAEGAQSVLSQVGLSNAKTRKYLSKAAKWGSALLSGQGMPTDVSAEAHAEINIFSVASGHLYERMLNIMMVSVMRHTNHTVKFWFIEQFLSPSFKSFVPILAREYGFEYEMVTYKWPHWLRGQKEKQREIWGYKILFLDVLFPLDLDKVIFVDADQIVRTDMYELVQHDLHGAPYGFTPMCDSRTEMEGFRFWKQGYWAKFLQGLPYHISALYVVDLKKFRQIAAGDRLRQQYHQLSADPASLSNLDQDLPNHMQMVLPIHSLPQDWLWCETWCSDEALKTAKTIDLCNNPMTKEPKLDRARRQVPEWTVYDDEIAALAKRYKESQAAGRPVSGNAADAGAQGEEEESIQERLQREDAERERKKQGHVKDEL